MPPFGHVAAGRDPGDHGHQRHIPRPRFLGRVPQGLQTAQRPVHPDYNPTHR
jgi:hypothetical protein